MAEDIFKGHRRFTVHDSPYWLFQIEVFQERPIVHLTCRKWCASAWREIWPVWAAWRRLHPEAHYAMQSSAGDSKKFDKLATKFGWRDTGLTVSMVNGTKRKLFIWPAIDPKETLTWAP